MKTVLQILTEARAKIEKPEAWTQGCTAKNADGKKVRAVSMEAVCWCSVGALMAVARDHSEESLKTTALCALKLSLPDPRWAIPHFNDDLSTTHADVLALFDRAIEKEQNAQ